MGDSVGVESSGSDRETNGVKKVQCPYIWYFILNEFEPNFDLRPSVRWRCK